MMKDKMELSEFQVQLELRIDWSELDYFKHVNNVSFFKYIQSARVNYWERIGLNRLHSEKNVGVILASTQCDFRKPLTYPGRVVILSTVYFIKSSSFGIRHVLLNETGEVSAEAKDVLVMYDFNEHGKVSIPHSIRMAIEKLENKKF